MIKKILTLNFKSGKKLVSEIDMIHLFHDTYCLAVNESGGFNYVVSLYELENIELNVLLNERN